MRPLLRSLLAHPIIRLTPILLLALLLRLWDLNARSIWFDEAVEFWSATPDIPEIIRLGSVSIQPPLFSIVLHFWLNLGSSVVAMRMLSVLLSFASVVGIMLWAYRNYYLGGAAIAGLSYALLPAEIRYAQEISEYALLIFGLTWSLVFLDLALREPKWRNWVLWGFFSLVALYCHYGATIPIASTTLISILRNIHSKKIGTLKKQLVTTAAIVIACVPLVVFIISFQSDRVLGFDIQSSGFQLSQLLNWFKALDEAFLFLTTGWPYTYLPTLAVRGLLILAALLALFVLTRRREGGPHPVFLWSLVTFSAYFLLTELGIYAHGGYGFRYSLILVPLGIMLITSILSDTWRSDLLPFALLYLGVFIIICSYSLPNRTVSDSARGEEMIWPETEDLGTVFSAWDRDRRGDETTYVYYGTNPAFRYYRYQKGEETMELIPDWIQTCWAGLDAEECQSGGVYYGAWIRTLPPEGKLESIEGTLGELPAQFWIIFSHTPVEEVEQVLAQLRPNFAIEKSSLGMGAGAYFLVKR
jgi:hypothetical protein